MSVAIDTQVKHMPMRVPDLLLLSVRETRVAGKRLCRAAPNIP